jgi:cytochrome P450
MSLRPEVQKRAQEEIDRVIGNHRLPTWSYRPNLPYVEAAYKEALRWHPVILGVAHASTEEQEYRGYRIPKGAFIYPNIW